jgi:cytochrome c oxidase subunit 3
MNPPTTLERPQQLPAGTGALGLFWLLLSLGMLFLTTLVAFWVVRGGMELEKLSVIPSGMPWGVWLASAVLVVLSLTAEAAARRPQADPKLMRIAGASSLAFLAVQAWNWYELYAIGHGAGSGLYAFCFFVLTGLHAAHVIGGVVYQFHAIKHADDPSKRRAAAVYWHFLFLCWVLILGTVHGTATEAGPVWVGRIFFVIAWSSAVVATLCWLMTVRLIWKKDGAGFGVLAFFPLFSVVFGWVRFQEHDNLRVMIAWQISIAMGMLGWIMSASLV